MEFNYSQIRRQAWQQVKDNRSLIVMAAIMSVLSVIITTYCMQHLFVSLKGMMKMEASSLVQTLLLVPMEYTLYVACLRITSQRDKLPWWEVFAAYIKHPKQNWFIPVAKTLSVVLLGIVTLGIGGVIGMYALSMVYFVTDENPDKSVDEVFKDSMDLTAGYKWKIFVLDLAFLGWYALIVFLASTLEVLRLTIPSDIVLVVGLMFIHPYWNAARALMYKQLQQIKAADEAIETPCQVVSEE